MKTSHIITKKLLAEQAMHRDPAYQEFARLGQILRESAIPQEAIPGIFKAVADGAAAGGNVDKEGDAPASNRTLIGKGADVGSAISKAFDSVKKYIGNSGPIKGVDAAVDSAQEQIMAAAGGQSGKVGQALEWYRELMKVPGMGLAAKSIILGLAALSGAGLGAAAVVGGIAFADRMLQGDEFSSSIWSGIKGGATAAALGAASNAVAGTTSPGGPVGDPDFYNNTPLPAGDPDFYNNPSNTPPGAGDQFGKAGGEYSDAANNAYRQNPDPSDAPVDPNTRADYTNADAGPSGGTYTIVKGDQLGFIAQAQGTTPELIRAANPDIDFSKALQPGQEINLPAAGTPGQGSLWADYKGGMYGDKAPGAGGQPGSPDVTPAPAGDPDFNKIDYNKPGPVTTDSMGQKLEYGIPVNDKGSFKAPNPGLQPEELAGQKAAYDNWLADFKSRWPEATQQPDGSWNNGKPGLAPVYPSNINPNATAADLANSPFRPKNESINYRIIPVDQVIDQALTIRMWALNESRGRHGQRPIYITESGRRLIFKMIAKQYQLDEGALDKLKSFNKKASAAISKFTEPYKQRAASFTNKITYNDLERGWKRTAKLDKEDSVDSEQVKTFLRSRGVKDPLINKVFAQLNIPTNAAAGGTALRPDASTTAAATDAAAGGTALRPNVSATAAATDAAGLDPRLGAALRSYAGTGSLTRQAPGAVPSAGATATTSAAQTAPAASATTPAPATATPKAPAAQNPAGFNAANVMKLPGMEKYAKTTPAAPAKTANFGTGPTGYSKTTTSFKQPGVKTAAAPAGTKVVAGGPTPAERTNLNKRIQAAQVAESVDIAEALWRKIKSKR